MMRGSQLLLLIVLLLGGAPSVSAAEDNEATVTYVTSKTVYVDIGSAAGLQEGQLLEVVRDGAVVARLRVEHLSGRRAACEIQEATSVAIVGDSVRVVGELRPASESSSNRASWAERARLRGRVSVDYLWIRDESGFGRDLSQPSGSVQLRGQEVFGSGWDLDLDLRARRSRYSGDGDVVHERYRLYRFRLSTEVRGWQWSLGRQYGAGMGALGIIDGAQVGWKRGPWRLQVLGGLQPSGRNLDVDLDRLRTGFVLSHERRQGRNFWRLGAGLVGAYQEGEIDREFVHLRGRWSRDRLSVVATQDLDLNRGWRGDVEARALDPTRTHLSARGRVAPWLTLLAGFDNRRPVRRWRDRETPETLFDDQYRQGIWAGLRHRIGSGYSWGLRVRSREGSTDRGADALTLNLNGAHTWRGHWDFNTRTTAYRNQLVEGWLQSGQASWTSDRGLRLSAFGGLRHESGRENDLDDFTDPWFGIETGLDLGRRWMLLWSAERSFEEGEAFLESWVSLAWRI